MVRPGRGRPPRRARRCELDGLRVGGRARGLGGRRLALRVLRRDPDLGRRAGRRVLRRPFAPAGGRADPHGPLHDDVRRVQRLGRAVALHGRHAGLLGTADGPGVPRQTGAPSPEDAAASGPGGALVLRVGGAARVIGVERRRRMVELGAAVPALGRAERVRRRRRDLHRPRGTPPPAGRPSDVRLGRTRRVLVVGDARPARRVHRVRRERRDLRREHLLLAGPVR